MIFTPRDEVVWKHTNILKISDLGPLPHPYEYNFTLPVPLADWDTFDYWERQRFHSMRDHLTTSDILFDIGTEQGWCNLIYAQFVGPQNVVLIEPTKDFWPNIRATWGKNYPGVSPLGFYDGLFSNKTTDRRDRELFWRWPAAADGDLIDRNRYQYIHDNDGQIPEITLDRFVLRSGIVPTALTMDVEGAELLVLLGAQETLKDHHPKVWVSIHPDLMARDYGREPEELHAFMADLGYAGEHLATDHEQHWVFL